MNNTLLSTDTKECPYCAEIIRAKAKICRFCGKEQQIEEPKESLDIDNRILCKDGSCIGVLGSDGRCNVCGKTCETETTNNETVIPNTQSKDENPRKSLKNTLIVCLAILLVFLFFYLLSGGKEGTQDSSTRHEYTPTPYERELAEKYGSGRPYSNEWQKIDEQVQRYYREHPRRR